jgi:hypothetical protein
VNPPDPEATLQDCARATNGNCLLNWNTTYEPPGLHALQARLFYRANTNGWDESQVIGPPAPFFSSNLCQFFESASFFTSRGAGLYARLPESNGVYKIELASLEKEPIKTFTGATSNGVVDVEWDARDQHGQLYTNDSPQATFTITLTNSGRSQSTKLRMNRFGREQPGSPGASGPANRLTPTVSILPAQSEPATAGTRSVRSAPWPNVHPTIPLASVAASQSRFRVA